MRQLIAGNWKMNGLRAQAAELDSLAERLKGQARADVLLCPPATLIASLAEKARAAGIALGGQDCHAAESGAHTGDLSAEMLKDAGATHVIVGHSERRADHRETDADIRAKAEAALRAGLTPIVCVGETREEREAGRAEAVVRGQVKASVPPSVPGAGFVLAYEPVWAIGTGLTPTLEDIEAMHAAIRDEAGEGVLILYGGSVKPRNARDILALPEVGGALVGGASLKAADFAAIVEAAPA
jgi:triosephosphate isomerase